MRIEYERNLGYVFCVDNDKIPIIYLFNISENALYHIQKISCKRKEYTNVAYTEKWLLKIR